MWSWDRGVAFHGQKRCRAKAPTSGIHNYRPQLLHKKSHFIFMVELKIYLFFFSVVVDDAAIVCVAGFCNVGRAVSFPRTPLPPTGDHRPRPLRLLCHPSRQGWVAGENLTAVGRPGY